MSNPRDDGRERRHREEFEKEEEQEVEEEVESFDDLLGGPTENTTAASIAETMRGHRGPRTDPANEIAAYQQLMDSDLRSPASRTIPPREQSTADEPEDGAAAAPPSEEEEDSLLPDAGESWIDGVAAAPAPNEELVEASDWLREES